MNKRLFSAILLILLLLSEVLPYGTVLNFATPNQRIPKYFSYFNLTPYGYGNFTPFLTALLSIAILILWLIQQKKKCRKLRISICLISSFAFFLSLVPLCLNAYTAIGAVISLCLLLLSVLHIKE